MNKFYISCFLLMSYFAIGMEIVPEEVPAGKKTWVDLDGLGNDAMDKYLLDPNDTDLHFIFGEYSYLFGKILAHGCKSFDNIVSIISRGAIKNGSNFSDFVLGSHGFGPVSSGNYGPFYVILNAKLDQTPRESFFHSARTIFNDSSNNHLMYLVPNDQKQKLVSVLKEKLNKEENDEVRNNILVALDKIFSFNDLLNLSNKYPEENWNSKILEEILKSERQLQTTENGYRKYKPEANDVVNLFKKYAADKSSLTDDEKVWLKRWFTFDVLGTLFWACSSPTGLTAQKIRTRAFEALSKQANGSWQIKPASVPDTHGEIFQISQRTFDLKTASKIFSHRIVHAKRYGYFFFDQPPQELNPIALQFSKNSYPTLLDCLEASLKVKDIDISKYFSGFYE